MIASADRGRACLTTNRQFGDARPSGEIVTGNFFQVVRVDAVMGRALGPADDARAGGNPVIVLSDRGWDRRFNRDPNVLGRTVLVAGAPFEIVGVMPAGFRGLAVGAPDFWAPLSQLAQFNPGQRGREDSVGVGITAYAALRPGLMASAGDAFADTGAGKTSVGYGSVAMDDFRNWLIRKTA
jgi:hypothetical protein